MAFIRFLIAAMLFVVVAGGTAYAWRADQAPKQKHKHHHQKKISVQLGRFKLPPIAPLFEPGEHEISVGDTFYYQSVCNNGRGIFSREEFDQNGLQRIDVVRMDSGEAEPVRGGDSYYNVYFRALKAGVYTLKVTWTEQFGQGVGRVETFTIRVRQ